MASAGRIFDETWNDDAQRAWQGKAHGTRILLVEDEPMVAKAVTAALADTGYTVCAHLTSGARATEALQTHRPDVVLMDIELGGPLDGIQTAARLREHQFDGPLIYLTGHASSEIVERASETQPHAYLLKPLTPGQLLASVQLAIARRDDERQMREELERARAVLAQVRDAAHDLLGPTQNDATAARDVLRRRLAELSERERQVFDLAVRGEPVASLSRTLFISPYTARNHLVAIYRKLGVGSRLELSTTYLPLVQ